jgi:hypothetical protein
MHYTPADYTIQMQQTTNAYAVHLTLRFTPAPAAVVVAQPTPALASE